MDYIPFTAHNVLLPDGTETKPGVPVTAQNGICQSALRTMNLVCPGGRVADLGCLEGGYAAAFAAAGFVVLGVEGRTANYERCFWLQERLGMPNLDFVQDDVRNIADYGRFDAVFCAGLLYHLDTPDAFLKLLGRVTGRLLIVQTHVAREPRDEHERRRGEWRSDCPDDADPWGSRGNHQSFRLHEPDLLAAIRDAGFDLVMTQHDYLKDIAAGRTGIAGPGNPTGGEDRGCFLGMKVAG